MQACACNHQDDELVVAGNEAIFQLLKRADSFMHSLFKSDNGPGRGCVSSTQQHKVESFQIEQQRRRTIFQEIKSQVEMEIRIHHCPMMRMSPGEVATQAQP
ncbi:ADP-ribosylation factor GTPase-activating protein 3 [Trichinella spiralis]|uniref:ADP-ribosylation factor GTPase-activating protein 3 n=1 Tax=Trichinella spiralis TaxID=6334 RepID=UPI0001EFEE27|nr:ADP-ribosylation factor GTPase-activating protein 3 [Trichinella spiralis]